jgi:hypothetical protein
MMARALKYTEKTVARFLPGTLERLDAVKANGEDRADVIREGVERELKRRERPTPKPKP